MIGYRYGQRYANRVRGVGDRPRLRPTTGSATTREGDQQEGRAYLDRGAKEVGSTGNEDHFEESWIDGGKQVVGWVELDGLNERFQLSG